MCPLFGGIEQKTVKKQKMYIGVKIVHHCHEMYPVSFNTTNTNTVISASSLAIKL